MDPAAALELAPALVSTDPAALEQELALASMDQATLALAAVAGPSPR